MSKAAKSAKSGSRSSGSGQFLGRAKDGTLIARPDFKPKSFTVRELREAVRNVQRREAEAEAS
jgi:hypothetical protein